MKHNASDVQSYLSALPEERKEAFSNLRNTILDNIPEGFAETFAYGMISYVVPHTIYPSGYQVNPKIPLPFCSIASQKNFIALYHSGIYSIPSIHDWFVDQYAKSVKYKLDMGKSCVRFKRIDAIPFELIGQLMSRISVAEWVESYEMSINKRK